MSRSILLPLPTLSGTSSVIIIAYFLAYCIQPLLSDIIKFNGAANSSTFLLLLPHYYSMMLIGLLPKTKKLSECDWRKGALLSVIDIFIQLLKKGGLVLAGSGVYAVVDSSSIIWTAIWSQILLKKYLSFRKWISLIIISIGLSLKAFQLNYSTYDDEFMGVALISVSSMLTGLLFVLNEKFMKDENPIEGPNLVCMMGVYCSVMITIWTVFWTLPNFEKLILESILVKNGNHYVIIVSFILLLLSGLIHSGTYWYILEQMGAVSSGVLKGLKVASVFILSHILFCEIQPSQCLTTWTCLSAGTCVIGVISYNITTPSPSYQIDEKRSLIGSANLEIDSDQNKVFSTLISV